MNSIFTWTFRRPPHNKIFLIVRRPLRGQPTVSIQIVLEFYVMGRRIQVYIYRHAQGFHYDSKIVSLPMQCCVFY